MPNLIVVYYPKLWPLKIQNAEIVSARQYLTDPQYSQMKGAKIYNLSRSYRYQSLGYYVSLLAAARGHHPMPSVLTIQDMKTPAIIRTLSDELDPLIQKSLKDIQSDKFTLSVYFGRNVAKKYDPLARRLFNIFPAPLLRAYFKWDDKWQIQNIEPLSVSDIAEDHFPFLHSVAIEYFEGKRKSAPRRNQSRYDLAILHDPEEKEPPSDEAALRRFIRAAEKLDMSAELITKEDSGHLLEFDGLFIRETTAVHHHTYRLSRRAHAEGLIVVDDPLSILRCANKVYLAELLEHHDIPTPKTIITHSDNVERVAEEVGYPCILKQPDGSFSRGVIKIENAEQFIGEAEHLLDRSDLVIAQEYVPTTFDWRIGILNRQPLFACKYFMADNHWQIIKRDSVGGVHLGKWETFSVENAPQKIVRAALRTANLIGDGLYGVDVKEINGKPCIIEVNDNPNIESGVEDQVLKEHLYLRIMEYFLNRIEKSKERSNNGG